MSELSPELEAQLINLINMSEDEIEAEILRHVPDPRWTEVIRHIIAHSGIVNDQKQRATRLVQAIRDRPDPYERYLHRNLLLAGYVLADDPDVDPRLGEEVARQLWNLSIKSEVIALQESTGKVLAELLGTRLRATIMGWVEEELEHNILNYRKVAYLAFDPAVCAAFLAHLTDSSLYTRRAAAAALDKMATSDPEVQAALLSLLADPHPYVRQTAAVALREVAASNPAVLASLLLVLGDNRDYVEHQDVIKALGQEAANNQTVRAILLPRLTDSSSSVRRDTTEILSGAAASDPSVRAALLPLLTDPDKDVREATERALRGAAARDPALRAALLPLLPVDLRPEVYVDVARALRGAEARDPEVLADLLPRLPDQDGVLRWVVADLLGEITSVSAMRAILLPVLTDPNGHISLMAMWIMMVMAISVSAVHDDLLPLLVDHSKYIRRVAAMALSGAAVNEPAVRAALFPLLADPDTDVRETVAYILSMAVPGNTPHSAFPRGKRIWNGKSRGTIDSDLVLRSAVKALRGVASSDHAVRAALLPFLADPSIVLAAAQALGGVVSDPAVRTALLPLLTNPQQEVRQAAVEALSSAANDPAVPAALRRQLANPDRTVRVAAAQASYNAPPNPELREQLGAMLEDTNFAFPTRPADAAFATLTRWAEMEDAAREAERRKG